jgi:hypothetical protein
MSIFRVQWQFIAEKSEKWERRASQIRHASALMLKSIH